MNSGKDDGHDGSRSAPGTARAPYAALQGVGRAMEILEVAAERPMRASEIAERLRLKWTTAHRSLTYLYEQGYLRRDDESGIYRIGPRLYYLGQAYLHNHPLLDAGSTALRVLAHDTRASAQINERVGFDATVLMSVDPALEMIPKTTVEHHFPLNTGSKGQVLLAYSDPSIFDAMTERPLPGLTAKSVTDADELAEILATIREQGYRVTREDVQVGTGSVAAPIFERGGEVAGAACVIVRASDLSEARTQDLVAQVVTMARQVSVRLGWRYGDAAAPLVKWRARMQAAGGDRRFRDAV